MAYQFTGDFTSVPFSATTTSTNPVVVVADTTGLVVGMPVIGAGIPAASVIASIVVNTSITLNNAATASASVTLEAMTKVIASVADTSRLAVGMFVSGIGVPQDAEIVSKVRDTSITLTHYPTVTGTGVSLVIASSKLGKVIAQSTAEAQALEFNPVAIVRAGSLAKNSSTAQNLAFRPVTFIFGKTSAKTSPAAQNLAINIVITQDGGADALSLPQADYLDTKEVTFQFGATECFSAIAISINITGGSDTDGLSLVDVIDEVLGMWGIFNRCSAQEFIPAAINIINSSLQFVWNNANDRNYWSNSTITLTFAADAESQDLDDDIQNVVGPCRLSATRRTLVPIATIGELETFSDIYLDGESATEPMAYYIDRMTQTGNDPTKITLRITPAPEEETDLLLEVVKSAPRFTAADIEDAPAIPIPHSYVESLLLPVARYQASAFYLFRKADQKETIDREYQQARMAIGLADPLPGNSGDNSGRNREVTK